MYLNVFNNRFKLGNAIVQKNACKVC